jgi:hypothetical protein
MIQQVIVYILLTLATAYVAYRFYGSIKKKQACDKCELMKIAKEKNTSK